MDPVRPLGRDGELAALDAALARAAAGTGPVAVVSGPPGIGKSTLLRATATRAPQVGALLGAGAAAEFDDVALGPIARALAPLAPALTADDRRHLGADRLAELAWALPGAARDAPGRLGDERFRTGRAVAALLARLAARRPLLLVLDDLHWADQATVEIVAHLLRRRVPGLLLALGYRPGRIGPPLRRALAGVLQPDLDVRLTLGPLPRPAADALLGDAVPADVRARLYTASGGNPFYLLELARSGARPGRDPVPEAVVAALRAEVAALAEPERLVAQGAAVAGEPFDPALAAPAAGVALATALDAVDALVRADLVTDTADPRLFRFRHPLVRQAVYELAGPAWRAAAHARLAATLAAQGAGPAERAPHVAASARPGDPDAVALLADAGRAALARSPDSAARWFTAALDLLDPDSPERPRLMLSRAKALATSGRLRTARETLAELADLLPRGADRADLLALTANIDHVLGRHDQARRMLTDALAAVPDPRSPAAARLQLALASVGMHTCDYSWMRAGAAEATAIARATGDHTLQAIATAKLAVAEYHVADVPAAKAACDEAGALVAALDERTLARRVDALAWLGWAQYFIERYDDAEATFTRGLEITRQRGLNFVLAELLAGRAATLVQRGRLAEAVAEADDGHDAADLTGARLSLAMAVMIQAETAQLRGEHAAALRSATDAVAVMGVDDVAARLLCAPALAEAHLGVGDPAAAAGVLLDAAGGPGLDAVERPWRPRWYEILTWCALAAGDVAAADRWAAQAEATAAGCGLAGRTATARRARAAVLVARGDGVRAGEAAAEAAELFAGVGCPVETARAEVLAGRAHALAGRADDAVRALRSAGTAAAAVGAEGVRRDAARALRDLGRRPARAAAADALSDREREVAGLAAQGLSNREIAGRLVLSERTVEGHLARARTKLRVRSRAGLVAALAADPART